MALKDKAMAIVVFLIFLNAVPNLMVASGVAEDIGYTPSIGGGGEIEQADTEITGDPDDNSENGINPSGGFGQTLFTLYTSLGGTLQVVMEILVGGELMLASLQVPDFLIVFFFAPKFILIGAALIYVLAGRAF